jgi:hypothetical protein
VFMNKNRNAATWFSTVSGSNFVALSR